MKKLFQYLIIEWKLLFRGVSLWIILLAIAGLFYLTTLNDAWVNDLGSYVNSMLYLFLSPIFLIAHFLAVYLARRDITVKAHLLHPSLPYRSWQVIGARLLALIIPFSFITLVPFIFYLIRGWMEGIAWSTLSSGVWVLCSYSIPLIFTITLSYWIGTWFKKRIVYLISFLAILLFIFVARLIFSSIIPAHWIHIGDMALSDLYSFGFYSELWGFTVDAVFWTHRWLYISIACLLIGGLVWRTMARRYETEGRGIVYSIIGATSLSIVLSLFSYSSIWSDRTEAYEHTISFYQQKLARSNPSDIQAQLVQQFLSDNKTQGEQNQINGNELSEQHKEDLLIGQKYKSLQALSYDLNVATTDDHVLKVDAKVQLIHQSDEDFSFFPISLRHHFDITLIQINGKDVSCEWEAFKDVLWITTEESIRANTTFELMISYSGQVNEWYSHNYSRAIDENWNRRVFIDPDKLFLPSFYGWYPRPSNEALAEYYQARFGNMSNDRIRTSDEIREDLFNDTVSDYRVIVKTDDLMTLISNGIEVAEHIKGSRRTIEFAATKSRGFDLIGGDISKWTVEGVVAEVSVILSNQVSMERSQEINEIILNTYEQVALIVDTLNGQAYFPKNVTFVDAEYPDRNSHGNSFNGSRSSTEQDSNRIQYVSHYTQLSRITDKYNIRSFIQELIEQYLLSLGDIVVPSFNYYIGNIITQYVNLTLTEQNGPFFPADSNWGPAPLYIVINELYKTTGHEEFLTTIQEIYTYMKQFKPDPSIRDHDQQFIEFLNSSAGVNL